jgi:antitoxin (DNA-binding transcriptional repressor) of toxin-antitoxin stability system
VLTSNDKGNVAELAIALEATKLGIEVLKPLAEHGRYDLAFDLGGRLVRVQCKWGTLDSQRGVVSVRVGGSRYTPHGYVLSSYSAEEIDAVAVYCERIEEVFLIPVEVIAGKKQVHLRIAQPRNSQLACINLASDFQLGAIAQLGERSAGSRKVAGSSPASSTPDAGGETTVGAHAFREKFGYWMERAAAGDEILITRRGRHYARLGPPDPQLATTDTAAARGRAAAPAAPLPDTARTSP